MSYAPPITAGFDASAPQFRANPEPRASEAARIEDADTANSLDERDDQSVELETTPGETFAGLLRAETKPLTPNTENKSPTESAKISSEQTPKAQDFDAAAPLLALNFGPANGAKPIASPSSAQANAELIARTPTATTPSPQPQTLEPPPLTPLEPASGAKGKSLRSKTNDGAAKGGSVDGVPPNGVTSAAARGQPQLQPAHALAEQSLTGASLLEPISGALPTHGAPSEGARTATALVEQMRAGALPHLSRDAPTQQLAQQIIRRFDGGSTRIEVRMDPAELGRVDVRLEVARDNTVQAIVSVENPATLTELVRHARDLERALSDAGLMLTGGGLSFDLADRRTGQDQEQNAGNHSKANNENAGIAAPLASSPIGLESWRRSRIDIWA
jgi:flagellar hook-length control protein FliK